MTTQPPNQPAPASGPAGTTKDPVEITAPLREWGALLLVIATAAFLLFALVDLVLAPDQAARFGVSLGFAVRADNAYGDFVGLVPVFFPLVAVLLATHVKPAAGKAQLITLIALIDYGVAGLLGLITMFVGFIHEATSNEIVSGFVTLLGRLVWLAVFAFAAFVVLRVYLGAYVVAKPKPAPGVYGYPAYPQGYPQPQQQAYQYQAQPQQYPVQGYATTGGYPAQPASTPPASTPYPAYAVTPPSSAPPAQASPAAPQYPTTVQPAWTPPVDTPSPPAPPTAAAYAAQTGYSPQPGYPAPPAPAGPGYMAQPAYQPPTPVSSAPPAYQPAPVSSAPPAPGPQETQPFDVATQKSPQRHAAPDPEPPTEANTEQQAASERTQALPPTPPAAQPGDEPTQRWG